MNVSLHWGNLEYLSNQKHTQDVVDKQLVKLNKFIKNTEATKIALTFKLDESTNVFHCNITLTMPKESFRIEKKGFSFEEAITEAVHDLKEVVKKSQKKIITLHRKTSLKAFIL